MKYTELECGKKKTTWGTMVAEKGNVDIRGVTVEGIAIFRITARKKIRPYKRTSCWRLL